MVNGSYKSYFSSVQSRKGENIIWTNPLIFQIKKQNPKRKKQEEEK